VTEPVAIVGMGCLVPGAVSPDGFWEGLLEGRSAITAGDAGVFGVDPALVYRAERGVPDRISCLLGGFIRDLPLDLDGYLVPADRLARVDRLGLWTLDAARQALRDAGASGAVLGRCGAVLGTLSYPTRTSVAAFGELYDRALVAALANGRSRGANGGVRCRPGETMTGGAPAELLATALGVEGPRLCLDAACASSLYAIRIACDALADGAADLMLAGAVSAAYPLLIALGFSMWQAFPEDGRSSHPLDRSSSGVITGEGAAMLVLKRLADAEADGDRVHAVIRGVGLSNDGRGRHPLAPNPRGQLLALERAYAAAGIAPDTIGYLECHATGTPLGDATELDTIERFFGARTPLLGAVKSNVGHMLTAAGMAAAIKVVRTLQAGVIPPTVGVRDPLVSRGGAAGGERVVTAVREWPGGPPRRGAVNAFGFGGTNAHLILESHASTAAGAGAPAPARRAAGSAARGGSGRGIGVAVAGAAVRLGPPRGLPRERWRGLEALIDEGLLEPPQGHYLESFEVDGLRLKAPAGGADRPIAQQLLAVDAADRALRDAGLREGCDAAVVVAMSTDLELHQYVARAEVGWRLPAALAAAGIALAPEGLDRAVAAARGALNDPPGVNRFLSFVGNIMASRIAALWDLTGPAFTVTTAEGGVDVALKLGERLVASGEAGAAAVVAVDVSGGPEAVLGRAGSVPADVAAALVLRPAGAGGRSSPAPAGVRTALDLARALDAAGARAPEPPPAAAATRVRLGGPRIADALRTALAPARRRGGPAGRRRLAVSAARSRSALAGRHAEFLDARAAGLRAVALMVPSRTRARPARAAVVWDEAQLLEFARGRAAPVLGPELAAIDGHRRRVRLPMPPYLLVSRVTELDALPGVLRPSRITTEYDVPHGAWYGVSGRVPAAIAFESGQCDLLLIAYLGVDLENRGERVYRLLDCSLTFLGDLPREGDTLRYEIRITRFARNGATLLFFFEYDCFAGAGKVLEMRDACAGFFTDEELRSGAGIVLTAREQAERAGVAPRRPEGRTAGRRALEAADLDLLSAGEAAAVFGPASDDHGRNPGLRLAPPAIRMLDRVTAIDPEGGPWGLGAIVGEKDLAPDDWYFPCHFRDDEVLAGSLMLEGCIQLLSVLLLSTGAHVELSGAWFQPVPGVRERIRCRGQVTPGDARLTYRLEVTELRGGSFPRAVANAHILVGDRIAVAIEGLSVGMRSAAPPPVLDERAVLEFATGSMAAGLGSEYEVYDRPGRRAPRLPNGPLLLMSRVVAVEAEPFDFRPGCWLRSEYDVPADPWFRRESGSPDTPYSILMELALQPCGVLSAVLRSVFLYPDADLHFRNLDGSGRIVRDVDVRGRTVRTRVALTSSTDFQGVIIQSFAFELGDDRGVFYEGTAAFGFFTLEALATQVGLDAGARVPPWTPGAHARRASPGEIGRPGGLRIASGRLELLDEVVVDREGGRHGLGHARGRAAVRPEAWYFEAHFHQDPVMPGSLGVEAILQALQAFAVEAGLGERFRAPVFAQALGHEIVWKYRGQIVRDDREMVVEVHVTGVSVADDRTTVTAEASLWKDGLRIYEVSGAAVAVREGP
jgi:3-oxoacyl-(acyl-carrier-protein) synthase/3-hydroxymyristoyl/3-hydroxydecanoyl-(acyl carrier protein) dehydratase